MPKGISFPVLCHLILPVHKSILVTQQKLLIESRVLKYILGCRYSLSFLSRPGLKLTADRVIRVLDLEAAL